MTKKFEYREFEVVYVELNEVNQKKMNFLCTQEQLLFMSPHEAYNIMQDDANSKQIIDLRSSAKFADSKLRSAVNFFLEDILAMVYGKSDIELCDNLRKDIVQLINYTLSYLEHGNQSLVDNEIIDLAKNVVPRLEYLEGTVRFHRRNVRYIILYDDDDEGLNTEGSNSLKQRWEKWIKGDINYVPCLTQMYSQWILWEGKLKSNILCVVQGGHSIFKLKYPFLITTTAYLSVQGSLPSEIIDGFLYLGSEKNASDDKQLSALRITHIVNMAAELDNVYPNQFTYLNAGIDDTIDDTILNSLHSCITFIENARREGNNSKVLVHCAMGISRSTSIVIAYLMARYDWSYLQTFSYIKAKRSCVNPNPAFQGQLISNELFIRSLLKEFKEM